MEAPYLKKFYRESVVPALMKSQGYKNVHQVPGLTKVVINSGFNASRDKNWIKALQEDITKIAGQKAVVTKAKKSISNFKLREGVPNGVCVTLRGAQMYDFLYRFIAVALPAIRDFRGVSRKLDGRGNYTLGINDHSIFPETASDGSNKEILGMDVTIVTSALTDEEGVELLSLLGMPFRKQTQNTEEQAEVAVAS